MSEHKDTMGFLLSALGGGGGEGAKRCYKATRTLVRMEYVWRGQMIDIGDVWGLLSSKRDSPLISTEESTPIRFLHWFERLPVLFNSIHGDNNFQSCFFGPFRGLSLSRIPRS